MSLRWQSSVVSVLVWMMIQISAVSAKEYLLTDELGKSNEQSGWEAVSSDLLSSLDHLEVLPDLLAGSPRSTDDPILHLPLDEALGASTFQDISGYGHDASCTGSSCPIAGQSGPFDAALSFDGTDDYLQVPHAAAFDFGTSQDFSVTLWVRSGDPHTWSSLVSNKSEWHWVTCGFIIAFWQDGATWTANAGDGTNQVHVEGGQINDDQWHHLAATFARTGDLIVYQDGQLMNSTPLSSVGSVTTGQSLSIGQLWDGSSLCNYAGFMDDVRIYDHVLTQEEVQSLMFAPCTVTSAADGGEGSLRSALAEFTCSPITFADDYDIALTSPLQIERAVTIDATDRTVTLRATDYTRVLDISADNVYLYNLIIRDGYLVNTELPDCLGAGIYCHGTASEPNNVVTLQNCSILNNYNALGYGGGIYNVLTKLYLLGCTVADNAAPFYWGGGLDQVTGCAFVIDSTFSNNTAGSAGGVMNESSELLLLNCTFSGNIASYDPSSGGALTNRDEYSRTLARNSIVANTPSGPGCGGVYVFYYSSNNLDDDGSCNGITDGFSQSSDLLLGLLGDYGGTTVTYPLLPGSAAIDAGTSSDFPTYDQRGLARFGACDVGAFESQGFTLEKIGGDDQIASVNSPFVEPLLVDVTANNSVEPVDGGRVIFTPPAAGAGAMISGSPAYISGGETSVTATANDTAGPYGVTASGSGMGAGVTFSLTNSQAVSPPPVGDGQGGTIAARFTKNNLESDLIEVTFDAASCTADRAVIVSGSISNFGGYVSCVQPDAGNTGTTTMDTTGLNNVWFNILWTDATTAGHPGYAFNGSLYLPRTWPAAGLCGKTIDDHSHDTCP